MKMLTYGLALSLAAIASDTKAQVSVNVNGEEIQLSALMDNCNSMTGQPEAQIACFGAVAKLLEAQKNAAKEPSISIPQALEGLKAAAQYLDNESGLAIVGTDCNIQVVYFNNYFHISRRNVSSIDLFSAQFDASRLKHDQTTKLQGGQVPLSQGVMDDGVIATMHGGVALESSTDNFEPKSARATISDYAFEVVSQLPPRTDQAFDFVLVHPQRSQASNDIWNAFDTFVKACKG